MNQLLYLLEELGKKEITVYIEDGIRKACLYKWHPKFKQIDLDVNCIFELISNNILEEDSGNFETGETHYVLSKDILHKKFYRLGDMNPLMPSIREIRLNRILN